MFGDYVSRHSLQAVFATLHHQLVSTNDGVQEQVLDISMASERRGTANGGHHKRLNDVVWRVNCAHVRHLESRPYGLQQVADRFGIVEDVDWSPTGIDQLQLRVDAEDSVNGGMDVRGRDRLGIRTCAKAIS